MSCATAHRHGPITHRHHFDAEHRHVGLPLRSRDAPDHRHDATDDDHHHDDHHHDDDHGHDHGHAHGLVDPSIVRSRAGVRAVAVSLAVLATAAGVQAVVFIASGSVALLADLIHNGGDALTAIPLGIAFVARSRRGERAAGYVVVGTIFVSAAVAAAESINRLIHPQTLDHLAALALAGIVGFAGNEIAAHVRLRAGHRLHSPALVADGHHARTDGFVSLGVIVSALAAWVGLSRIDPLVGLAISALILRITWQAWQTVRHDRA
jgi:divalent metal cation (Fe/Co/Zn/Cd) transporter